MEISESIKDALKKADIPLNDGLTYLLSLHYGLKPSYIPELLVKKILAYGIITIKSNNKIVWNISLFEENIKNFEWVKDYREAFKKLNPDRAGSLPLCITRFKRFFADNPSIRVEDVKGATKLYFQSVKDTEYLMKSHNFIYKDKGINKTSEIEVWIERYKESCPKPSETDSNSRKMQ